MLPDVAFISVDTYLPDPEAKAISLNTTGRDRLCLGRLETSEYQRFTLLVRCNPKDISQCHIFLLV